MTQENIAAGVEEAANALTTGGFTRAMRMVVIDSPCFELSADHAQGFTLGVLRTRVQERCVLLGGQTVLPRHIRQPTGQLGGSTAVSVACRASWPWCRELPGR